MANSLSSTDALQKTESSDKLILGSGCWAEVRVGAEDKWVYQPEPGEERRLHTILGMKVIDGTTWFKKEWELSLLRFENLPDAFTKDLVQIEHPLNNSIPRGGVGPQSQVQQQQQQQIHDQAKDVGYTMFDQTNLPSNIKRIIAQMNEKLVPCKCGKYFSSLDFLKNHQETRCGVQ